MCRFSEASCPTPCPFKPETFSDFAALLVETLVIPRGLAIDKRNKVERSAMIVPTLPTASVGHDVSGRRASLGVQDILLLVRPVGAIDQNINPGPFAFNDELLRALAGFGIQIKKRARGHCLRLSPTLPRRNRIDSVGQLVIRLDGDGRVACCRLEWRDDFPHAPTDRDEIP